MDFVKDNFHSKKQKNKSQVPGKPIPDESLLLLTKRLHRERIEMQIADAKNFKMNNASPAVIWVSMSSLHEHFKKKPNPQKDSALDDLGCVLADEFKFNLLNKKVLEINNNFVNQLVHYVDEYLKNSKKPNTELSRPSINIVLSAHGSPSWFFGPINNYYFPKYGCTWPDFEFDAANPQSIALLNTFQHPQFIITKDFVYLYYPDTRQLLYENHPGEEDKLWKSFKKSELKSNSPLCHIEALNSDELKRLLSLFPKRRWKKITQFNMASFIEDECQAAKVIADSLIEVERRMKIEFTSVILFSCNSASEFFNENTFEASLSSARVLSTLYRDRFVIGGIGLNSNGKAQGVYYRPESNADKPSPKLEKTLTVYQNERVIYRPNETFYLSLDFLGGLNFIKFFKQEPPFIKSEFALEKIEKEYHFLNFIQHESQFAGLQIQVLDKMLQQRAFVESSRLNAGVSF